MTSTSRVQLAHCARRPSQPSIQPVDQLAAAIRSRILAASQLVNFCAMHRTSISSDNMLNGRITGVFYVTGCAKPHGLLSLMAELLLWIDGGFVGYPLKTDTS